MFRYIGVEGNTTFYDDPPLDRKRLFFLQNRKLFAVFSGFFGFFLWVSLSGSPCCPLSPRFAFRFAFRFWSSRTSRPSPLSLHDQTKPQTKHRDKTKYKTLNVRYITKDNYCNKYQTKKKFFSSCKMYFF